MNRERTLKNVNFFRKISFVLSLRRIFFRLHYLCGEFFFRLHYLCGEFFLAEPWGGPPTFECRSKCRTASSVADGIFCKIGPSFFSFFGPTFSPKIGPFRTKNRTFSDFLKIFIYSVYNTLWPWKLPYQIHIHYPQSLQMKNLRNYDDSYMCIFVFTIMYKWENLQW